VCRLKIGIDADLAANLLTRFAVEVLTVDFNNVTVGFPNMALHRNSWYAWLFLWS